MKHAPPISQKTEWLTPPEFIADLGPFDLDPCSPIVRPWPTAAKHYDSRDNGLGQEWSGVVWCNPPFGTAAGGSEPWARRMAEHGNGIMLHPARLETRMFFRHVWPSASAIFFIKGRPHFYHVDGTRAKGNSGVPICLIAYGNECATRLQKTAIPGKFIEL